MSSICLGAPNEKRLLYPSYPYDVARAHEIKPHRRTIPLEGVDPGFNQLRLTLTVSPTGDVVDADATGDREMLKFWPQLKGEVLAWKFTPFEENGEAITAEVKELRLKGRDASAVVLRTRLRLARMVSCSTAEAL